MDEKTFSPQICGVERKGVPFFSLNEIKIMVLGTIWYTKVYLLSRGITFFTTIGLNQVA